jgi:hypothetical protein
MSVDELMVTEGVGDKCVGAAATIIVGLEVVGNGVVGAAVVGDDVVGVAEGSSARVVGLGVTGFSVRLVGDSVISFFVSVVGLILVGKFAMDGAGGLPLPTESVGLLHLWFSSSYV